MSGKVLKIERIKADIPQKEMAEAMGVTPSIVSMWERKSEDTGRYGTAIFKET